MKVWIQQILNIAHKKPGPYTTPMHSTAQLSCDLEDTSHLCKRLCDWRRLVRCETGQPSHRLPELKMGIVDER